MTADLLPVRLLLVTVAGWVNRHQQHVVQYLVEENRALRERLSGRRVRLTDDPPRRLAAKGQRLGRRVMRQVAIIVTPDADPALVPAVSRAEVEVHIAAARASGIMREIAALPWPAVASSSVFKFRETRSGPWGSESIAARVDRHDQADQFCVYRIRDA
jgi:hypothetical protein